MQLARQLKIYGTVHETVDILLAQKTRNEKELSMDDESGPFAGLMIFLIFIIWIGLLHAFQAALENTSEGNARQKAEDGSKLYQTVLKHLESPFLMRNTSHIIMLVFGMVCGYVVLSSFVHPLGSFLGSAVPMPWNRFLAAILIFFVFLAVALAFGYLAPYKIGSQFSEAAIAKLTGFADFCSKLVYPISFCVECLGNLMVKICGIDPNRSEDDVTEDEIIELVDEAHEQGVIRESEAEMIQNIMEYGNKSAKDIMTHRKNINAIDADLTLGQALDIMFEENNTRYPVYQDNIDNVIGIVLLKDAAIEFYKNQQKDTPLKEIKYLIRHVAFVPETRGIDSIFKVMQAKKIHMAVVIDEYGQTAGIVTMEDILEEIVGNILDEYDDMDEFIQPLFDDSILMDGLTPLEQVGEVLGIDFEEEEFETLNGYLTDKLGYIPTEEDAEIIADGYSFQILDVDNNILQKLRVVKLQKEEDEEICQDIQNSLI